MKLNPSHFNFGLTKYLRDRLHAGKLRTLRPHADLMFGVSQYHDQHNYLDALCQKHGTDKGGTDLATHPCGRAVNLYATIYDLLFYQKCKQINHLLECGIGSVNPQVDGHMKVADQYKPGASLRMWREYFPCAKIVGLDIDAECLFADERIETHQCDQTDPQSIKDFTDKIGDVKFDIIIDDGLHTTAANIIFFENIIDRLADDGVYIIEDVGEGRMADLAEYFKDKNYLTRFILCPRIDGWLYGNLIVITKALIPS